MDKNTYIQAVKRAHLIFVSVLVTEKPRNFKITKKEALKVVRVIGNSGVKAEWLDEEAGLLMLG